MIEALILACAPNVEPSTIRAVIEVESAGDPLALNVNRDTGAVRLLATDLVEAIELAKAEIAAGNSVDVGLMQINSRNLERLGYTIEQIFNPCTNIRAGDRILSEAYWRAASKQGEGQDALRAALSAYNTGDFARGLANGYVDRYYGKQLSSGVQSAAIYSADPTVPMRFLATTEFSE